MALVRTTEIMNSNRLRIKPVEKNCDYEKGPLTIVSFLKKSTRKKTFLKKKLPEKNYLKKFH